jgi:hypothetical protein
MFSDGSYIYKAIKLNAISHAIIKETPFYNGVSFVDYFTLYFVRIISEFGAVSG